MWLQPVKIQSCKHRSSDGNKFETDDLLQVILAGMRCHPNNSVHKEESGTIQQCVCVEMKFRIDDSSYAVYSYFRDSFTNQKGNLDDVQVKKR